MIKAKIEKWLGLCGMALLGVMLMFPASTYGANGSIKIAFATHLKPGGVDEWAMLKFKETAEKFSNGKFAVEVFTGGVLGKETDLWELLATNEVQMNMCGEIVVPAFAKGTYVFGTPFLYQNPKEVREVLDGPLGIKIKDLIRKNGKMHVLGLALRAPRMLTSKKPIRSVEDLKGLKLRMPPIPEWIEVWKELGANVISLSGSEIFGALQSNLIEAQDNPASVNVSFKFYELQKYMVRTNHIIGFRSFLISQKFYDSLTTQQKGWIDRAAAEAIEYYEKTEYESVEKNITVLKEKGMTMTEIDSTALRRKIVPAIERLRKNWNEDAYQKYIVPHLPK